MGTSAIEAAGRLLTVRGRSESELRQRLVAKKFPEDEVEAAMTRLRELNLVDDGQFAAQWVEERSSGKGYGSERLRRELAAKGVAPELIESALQSCGDGDLARATELAAKQVRKVVDLPLNRQATRLYGFLKRRGFSSEVTDSAVRAVLPPEGWD
ncbi:MAG TPA: regulatory protein RecX [Actinomycetota bacterium]|nr:regulatory protein RecX [Actinomycetota bacterium]